MSTPDTAPIARADPGTLETRQIEIIEELVRDSEALAALDNALPAEITTAAENLLETTNRAIIWNSSFGEPLPARSLLALRGTALWNLDRIDEADLAFEQAGPELARAFDYLVFRHDLAWRQRDWPKVLEILEADATIPDTANAIAQTYDDFSWQVLRGNLGFGDANGRVAELLILVDWHAELPPGERDWIYLFAMLSRHENGDQGGAREALSMMRNPTYIVDILLDPDLADYHSQVEAEHGADLGLAAANIRSELATLWPEQHDNASYLLNYLISLRSLGEWQEISDIFSPIAEELDAAITDGQSDHYLMNGDGFFVVNYLADAEMRLDRQDMAIARMDSLLRLDLQLHPNLINQAINRLELLLQRGDYQAVLDTASELDQVSSSIVAPYGLMLVRSAAACAAHLADDSEESATWLDRLLAMDSPMPIAVLETYLCLGDMAAAEAHIIETASSMRYYFHRRSLWEPRGDYDRLIKRRADALLNRQEVRRALDEAGGLKVFALAHLSA